jgi:coproporphyrinogen III oxidase-like Fe-S oxidoreductase
VTIEASPDTLSEDKLAAYREAGVTRISMGVQSFDDRRLARQGRSHRADQARAAAWMVREEGIEHLNIDLMCGLPDETLQEVELSVQTVLELPVTHVSLYPYVPAEGTVMYRQLGRGTMHLNREERIAAYNLGRRMLEDAGFPEYAIYYFGHTPCRADLVYYRLDMDWIGFGPGANSLLDRKWMLTYKELPRYTASPTGFMVEKSAASPHAALVFLHQGLGTWDGVDATRWQERTGVSLDETLAQNVLQQAIEYLQQTAGLIRDERGIRLPRERIADTFIDASFWQTPSEGRDRVVRV